MASPVSHHTCGGLISELSHVRVQLRFQIRTCIYIYIYIYICGRTSSYVRMLGGT